jgi:hypothetical protein
LQLIEALSHLLLSITRFDILTEVTINYSKSIMNESSSEQSKFRPPGILSPEVKIEGLLGRARDEDSLTQGLILLKKVNEASRLVIEDTCIEAYLVLLELKEIPEDEREKAQAVAKNGDYVAAYNMLSLVAESCLLQFFPKISGRDKTE